MRTKNPERSEPAPLRRICIVGDPALVAEYAAACLKHWSTVAVRPNRAAENPPPDTPMPLGARNVARPARATDLALELTNTSLELKRTNLAELDRILASSVPILTSSVSCTLAEQSSWISHPERIVGIGALPSLLSGELMEFAESPLTSAAAIRAAKGLAASLGKESAVLPDSVGLVLPRILCALANEAYFALAEGVAPATALDAAMKLGTHYPLGPLEWAERIGVQQIFAVMAALHRTLGEERYRVAPLLRQAAALRQAER